MSGAWSRPERPSSAAMTTNNGRACAKETRAMNKDSLVQPADMLRPRHVGAPIRRTEDPRLLTGRGEYTADRKPDRALHAAFRRSEQSHARIMSTDPSAAQAAPGVIAVLTAESISGDFKPVIPFSRMANYYATPIVP